MKAARAASTPASMPCARRAPNSTIWRPAAAPTIRAARLATDVWKATIARSAVSTSCASGSGAVTRSSGAGGNTGTPSSTAHTSPLKPTRGRYWSKNSRRTPCSAGSVRRCAMSSSVKRSPSKYAMACSSPAATRHERFGGSSRTYRSKVADASSPAV